MDIAFLILEAMDSACSGIAERTAVQARIFRFADQQDGWPLVQWRWKRVVDVVAFFNIDKDHLLSMVILFGTGRAEVDGRLWRKMELKWRVAEMTDLRQLFLLVHRFFPTAKRNVVNTNVADTRY